MLSLRNNKITGTVPYLPNAIFLDMGFNNLTGFLFRTFLFPA